MSSTEVIEQLNADPRCISELIKGDRLLDVINKGAILSKDPGTITREVISDFAGRYPVQEILAVVKAVTGAIDRITKRPLTADDLILAEQIAVNVLNKNPKVKLSELTKDIKVALSTQGHDGDIHEVIERSRRRHIVDIDELHIDRRFLPSRRDSYLIEEKKGAFIGITPCHIQPGRYILAFDENKLFMLGYIDGFHKQEHTRSQVLIKPLYILLPGGKVLTKPNNDVLCNNVVFEEIPDTLAERIKSKFLDCQDQICIGLGLSGKNVRMINGIVEYEHIPVSELMDDLQSRVAVVGAPGNGKTVLANIIQKQIMQNGNVLQGGTVTIAKDVAHLTKVGCKFKSFAKSYPDWDRENLSEEFVERNALHATPGHLRVVISNETCIPDISQLSRDTIIAIVKQSHCSPQVISALTKHLEESHDVVDTLNKAKEGSLLSEEYLDSQDYALRRLVNSLIPANYGKIEKINLMKTLRDNKDVSFFVRGVNGEIFTAMILWELYVMQLNKDIGNPVTEGKLLVIDECQKLVRDDTFKDIFTKVAIDSRNYGICMMTIFQNEKEAEKHLGYAGYAIYKTTMRDGKRLVKIREKTALIPCIAPRED